MHKQYSFFPGKFQPFHVSHKKLIEVVLNEGKNVCIAIRDTKINKDNPYTYKKRKKMIREMMKKWNDRIIIIKIPDIEEIFWGRKVGWNRREIKLDKDSELVSGTKIREGKL